MNSKKYALAFAALAFISVGAFLGAGKALTQAPQDRTPTGVAYDWDAPQDPKPYPTLNYGDSL